MLLVIILICIAFLLLLIFWATRNYAIFHIENIKTITILLAVAQSFILSLQAGQLLWSKLSTTPQQYTDFVSGNIGFSNSPKSIEYYALVFAIIVFVVSFLLVLFIYDNTGNNEQAEQDFVKLSLYALIPAAIMAGQSLRIANTTVLLNISSLFVILSLVITGFLRFILKKGVIADENIFSVGSRIMLTIIFLVMSEIGAALFLPKLGIILSKLLGVSFTASEPGIVLYRFGLLTLLLLILFSFLVFKFRSRFGRLEEGLDLGLSLSQVGLPLLFSALLSVPVIYLTGQISFLRYRPALYVIVLILALTAYIDLIRRFRDKKDGPVSRLVSPWMLFAILIYLQSFNTGWPWVATDEYHFGEFYLPWWAFMKFGSLPYLDFQPARGLVNYIPGFLSWLFYDNTFSGQSLIYNIFSAFYIFLAFFGLRKIVGDLVAFLSTASLFIYVGGPAGNVIVVIACLAVLLKASYDKNYVAAFWLWVGFSIFIPLFSIAEGSVFVLGTLPLGFWLMIQAYRFSSKSLVVSLLIFFFVAVVLALTTDVDDVIISAVKYLLVEAGVNDLANSIPWQYPLESRYLVTTGYLWQMIRFSWLILLIPIVVRLVRGRKMETIQDKLFLVALFIICIILIPRAAGRIDANDFSRPGLTSIVMIFCALPLVILPPIKNSAHKAGAVLLIALFLGVLGKQEYYANNAKTLYKQVIYEPKAELGDGNVRIGNTDLHNLNGNAIMKKDRLSRQKQIKRVLDQLLTPQETYFDTTNHIADYGYQGREIPVSIPAIYNASSTPVQLRMIEQLEEKKIPLVLLDQGDLLFDGGVPSLRSYVIYKYLLDNYSPFMDEYGRAWMIRKGEEERLTNTSYKLGTAEERLAISTSIFWQGNLSGLPAAWGNSVQSLNRKMDNPRDILKNGSIEQVNGLNKLKNGDWQVNGPDPYIVFSLPEGTKGDLLLLEMSQKIDGGSMQVFWESDLSPKFSEGNSFLFSTNSSNYLIPLSTAPSWEQSSEIRKLRLDFPDTYTGIIHFNTLSLFDRVLEEYERIQP